jgi:hypothetical protein
MGLSCMDTNENESKWMTLIEKIGNHMEKTMGKKIVVVNIEAGTDECEYFDFALVIIINVEV